MKNGEAKTEGVGGGGNGGMGGMQRLSIQSIHGFSLSSIIPPTVQKTLTGKQATCREGEEEIEPGHGSLRQMMLLGEIVIVFLSVVKNCLKQ